MPKEKLILAYSGGLDTTVAIPWLKEKYGYDIVACLVDVGQAEDLQKAKATALKAGALEAQLISVQETFAEECLLPSLMANALYEGKYPLVSALSRPVIVKALVEAAKHYQAVAVAHGCTAKGNDQVRFDVSLAALAPELAVIAPAREWGMTREETMAYGRAHGLVLEAKKTPYSIDANLWGRAIECGILEDPFVEPPEDAFVLTKGPAQSPDKPEVVEIEFTAGVPVALNGKALDLVELITALGEKAGAHGVGRIDMIESRLVGIKSREVYECPAAMTLIAAHQDLEGMVLPRELLHYKAGIEQKYAEMVYFGLWFHPLREALQAFVEESQAKVTGTVKVKLYKGQAKAVGRKSPYSLYQHHLATYDKGDAFNHGAAHGFIELWGLDAKLCGMVSRSAQTKPSARGPAVLKAKEVALSG
jgi:argininosuccinate synthase